jgi:hypothetical protein
VPDERDQLDEMTSALVARLRAMPASDPRARAAILARVRGRRQAPWRTVLAEAWQPSMPLLAAASIAVAAIGIGYGARVMVEPAAPVVADNTTSAPDNGTLVTVSNVSSRAVPQQFILDAPKANRVALVGDFNNWDPTANALQRSASGMWEVTVPLVPGRHTYAYLVNDSLKLDPRAPSTSDDFGRASSVILVSGR